MHHIRFAHLAVDRDGDTFRVTEVTGDGNAVASLAVEMMTKALGKPGWDADAVVARIASTSTRREMVEIYAGLIRSGATEAGVVFWDLVNTAIRARLKTPTLKAFSRFKDDAWRLAEAPQ